MAAWANDAAVDLRPGNPRTQQAVAESAHINGDYAKEKDVEVVSIYRPDQYLAAVVGFMFLSGIVLILRWARQRSRTRQRNGAHPARRHKAA